MSKKVARTDRLGGYTESENLTAQAQLVDEHGNVYMCGRLVGKLPPGRPGWSYWGLEAAGMPEDVRKAIFERLNKEA